MPADLGAYRIGEFTLAASERLLLRDGQTVFLRPKAFETLRYLVERHGHLATKDDLLNRVWADTNVSEAVLTHCISEVRQALGDDARHPRYVKTISRSGYKFIADVAAAESAASGQALAAVPAQASAIAVLPFANISQDPDNEYFCDGLSEELINRLTKARQLRVVAHSSSFSFKGRDIDARKVASQLNVGWILEGSVRKSGDRLRISAQLIDSADGCHVWCEQYDRRLEDLFAVQDEISQAILDNLKIELRKAQPGAVARRPTGSMVAYDLYLKGRSFWHRRFKGCLQKASECFQQAIDEDPGFALAYTGLADCYGTLGAWAFAPPGSVFPKVTALARKALDIDDTLAEAHASLGFVHMFHDWDWDATARRFERAIELNPGSALIRVWNGHYLSIVGRFDEAIAEMKLARDLDPLSPIVSANLGWTYILAHRYDRAIGELLGVLALDPGNGIGHLYLGHAYAELRRYAQASETFRAAAAATGGMPWIAESIAWVQGLSGDRRQTAVALREAEARRARAYVPSSAIAMIHLGRGDDDAVIGWLERSVAERDVLMPWIRFMPCFGRLHGDPRFQDLLRRIGGQPAALAPHT